MLEYVDEAIVLDKEPNGDVDARVSLFTKNFGKLKAKAKSARKITSKLSGHLEPGNVVAVRLVEKNGLQVVDALKISPLNASPSHLYFLDKLLAEAEPEPKLWPLLVGGSFNWREILKTLGWDPTPASCGRCGRRQPPLFHIDTQTFFCESCGEEGRGFRSGTPKEASLFINLNDF